MFLLAYSSWGQQKSRFFIGVEVGSTSIVGERNDQWQIRQEASRSGTAVHIDANASLTYFGIKPEYRFMNNKMSLFLGIRYISITADITPSTNFYDYYKTGQDYLFLRYKMDNTSMHFGKVRQISEKISYLSVPLEWQYVPFWIGNIGFYGKVGGELGVKIYENSHIDFSTEAMQKQEKEILQTINPTRNPLYANSYVGIGCKATIREMVDVSLEFNTSLLHSKKNTSILNEQFVGNIQLSLQIPLTKEQHSTQL